MTAIKSQGSQLLVGDGGDPTETFNAIGELVSVSGLGGGSPTEIDTTSLASTGKEFILGLKDEGEITITLNLDTADTQQTFLRTSRDSATVRNFRFDLADTANTQISFAALVKTFQIGAAVDDKITLEIALRVTGAAVWA